MKRLLPLLIVLSLLSLHAYAKPSHADSGQKTWTDPVTGMEFVWVPGGCFQMGQTEAEKQWLIQDAGQL
jgi:formylglycine-generating enzyme required for sulfatase activity